MRNRSLLLAVTALPTTAALLFGCASSSSTPTAYVRAQSLSAPLSRIASPDACDKKRSFGLNLNGGSFAIPKCAGWTGTITYPSDYIRHYHFGVTSSVTNNFGAPPPPMGTAIFYLSTAMEGRTFIVFNNTGVTNTITSPQLTSEHSYSLMVYNFISDDQCQYKPAVAPDSRTTR